MKSQAFWRGQSCFSVNRSPKNIVSVQQKTETTLNWRWIIRNWLIKYLINPIVFQTCIHLFLVLNTKEDILKKVAMQRVPIDLF